MTSECYRERPDGSAITILTTTAMGRVMQGLVSDIATDPELAGAFRREVITLRL